MFLEFNSGHIKMPRWTLKLNFLRFINVSTTSLFGAVFLNLVANAISNGLQKQTSGIVSSIPYVLCLFAALFCGLCSQFFREEQSPILPTTLSQEPRDEVDDLARAQMVNSLLDRMHALCMSFEDRLCPLCRACEQQSRQQCPKCIGEDKQGDTCPDEACSTATDEDETKSVELQVPGVLDVLINIPTTPGHGMRNANVRRLINKFEPNRVHQGSVVLRTRIEIRSCDGPEVLDDIASRLVESMKLAHNVHKNSTLQLGNFAILKYTDAGLQSWMLEEESTPTLFDSSCSRGLMDFIAGRGGVWRIRGLHLRNATLKVSTTDASEHVTVLQQYTAKSGEDILICEEPLLVQNSTPLFRSKVCISAFKTVEVEEGLSLVLQSEAKDLPVHWSSEGLGTLISSKLYNFLDYWRSVVLVLISTPWQLVEERRRSSDYSIPSPGELTSPLTLEVSDDVASGPSTPPDVEEVTLKLKKTDMSIDDEGVVESRSPKSFDLNEVFYPGGYTEPFVETMLNPWSPPATKGASGLEELDECQCCCNLCQDKTWSN